MLGFFSFLRRHHEFLFFLFLSGVCVWLLHGGRHYLSSWGFNASHRWIGSFQTLRRDAAEYFLLGEINARLREENLYLRRALYEGRSPRRGTAGTAYEGSLDSIYTLTMARLVNQTMTETRNFITLDKGHDDGIRRWMGVLGPVGIVGRVAEVSAHFSTAHTLLHREMYVSVLLQRSRALASLHWDGRSIYHTKMAYLSRHISLHAGDTVISSGYGGIYPPNIPIGLVEDFVLRENALFYTNVRVRMLLDYAVLDQVYVVRHRLKKERDSIEAFMYR